MFAIGALIDEKRPTEVLTGPNAPRGGLEGPRCRPASHLTGNYQGPSAVFPGAFARRDGSYCLSIVLS